MTMSAAEYRKRVANPRRKRNQPERNLHTEVTQMFERALPPGAYWFPIPNGSHRNKIIAAKMKAAGEVKPGAPDLCIVYRGKPIFIELKAKGKKPTPLQSSAHELLTLAGALVFVSRSTVEVYAQLECFMPMKGMEG